VNNFARAAFCYTLRPMRVRLLLVLVCVLAVAGCSGSKHTTASTTSGVPARVAATPQIYANRIVNLFLRPMSHDLGVLNELNTPDIKLYIAEGDKETLSVLGKTLTRLKNCARNLDLAGVPPPGHPNLDRIDGRLRVACSDYEKIAIVLEKGVADAAALDPAQKRKGQNEMAKALQPSKQAAIVFGEALELMRNVPQFRRAGLAG
jgi:hypothetical protein